MKRPRMSAGRGVSRAGKLAPSLTGEGALSVTHFSTLKKRFRNPLNLFCTIPTQFDSRFMLFQTINRAEISVASLSRNGLPLITPETPRPTPTHPLYSKLSKGGAAPRQHKHQSAQRSSGRVGEGFLICRRFGVSYSYSLGVCSERA